MATKSSILCTEGNGDKFFVIQLLKKHAEWDEDRRPLDVLGKSKSRKEGKDWVLSESNFENVMKEGPSRFGVIVDADDEPIGDVFNRFYSLVESKVRPDWGDPLAIPSGHDPRGTVLEFANGFGLGLWIMPDNAGAGKLEDFAIQCIRPHEAALKRLAFRWPQDARAAGVGADFEDKDLSKARIHAFLALRNTPGPQLHEAIERNLLDSAADFAIPFIDWAFRLFPNLQRRPA